jgi:electron transport complex protein RnfG
MTPDTGWRDAIRAGGLLSGCALLVFGLVGITVEWTEPRMAWHRERDRLVQVQEVAGLPTAVPGALRSLQLPATGELHQNSAFTAYQIVVDGRVDAVVLPAVAPDGYSGQIELLVGIDAEGRIRGVRVTRHHETAGLGDRIDSKHSAWITQFDGRSLGNPPEERWNVRKDGGAFDQITGATLTPRAVIHAVAGALKYFRQHREELLVPALEPVESP